MTFSNQERLVSSIVQLRSFTGSIVNVRFPDAHNSTTYSFVVDDEWGVKVGDKLLVLDRRGMYKEVTVVNTGSTFTTNFPYKRAICKIDKVRDDEFAAKSVQLLSIHNKIVRNIRDSEIVTACHESIGEVISGEAE